MARLTKRVVDSLSCVGTAPAFLWDDALAGFGVKALPGGAKKFVVKYRTNGGGRSAPQRWISLGGFGQLTCDQARDMAQQILAAVARGEDPQAEKFKRRTAPTLTDAWAKFEAEELPLRKPLTRREYVSQWRLLLEPKLGRLEVASITRADVDGLHKALKATPYRANRALALCSRLLSLTERWEWRPQGTNPCRYVSKFKEAARSRYLSDKEQERIGAAMRQLVAANELQPAAANAIKLLLYTGARLNELLTAKWAWVDLSAQTITLPDSKTGEKPIYLSDAAITVLRDEQEANSERQSEYVFAGRSQGKHMINLRKPWTRVCAAAGITGVRLHDLRHTAASIAAGQGASLPIIGRLLGHSQAQTTQRYAHVDTNPALKVANAIGEALGARLG